MLPGEDTAWIGAELTRRFGLARWQMALSASDANRFVIRWARALTGRTQILVFNGCYHGTVEDVFVDLIHGQPRTRDSLLGQVHDITRTTRSIEFNDLAALEAALADGQVACLLAEPVMTNIGMVLPEPGFWQAAQAPAWHIRNRGRDAPPPRNSAAPRWGGGGCPPPAHIPRACRFPRR